MRTFPIPAVTRPTWHVTGLSVSTLALPLGAIILAGFALRLAWVLYLDTIPLGGDPHWYYVVGINLANGFGFVTARNEFFEIPGPGQPTAFWPPGYPFALAGLFKAFGVSITAAKVMNAVLGALTIPLVYGLAHKILGRGPGLLAAGLFAILPPAITGLPLLWATPLFTFLFVGALWLLVSFPMTSRNGWPALVAFGVVVGLATLTRGQGVVLIPVALLYWSASAGWRAATLATAAALLVAVSVITPWTIRNAVELHAFIPISTSSGTVLRIGHGPDSIGMHKWSEDEIGGFRMWQSLENPEWEVQGYREYTRLAITYAVTHPRRELELAGLKVFNLYRADRASLDWLETLGTTPIEPQALRRALPWLMDFPYYVMLFAAVASVPLWLRRDARRWLLVNVVVLWTMFHIVFNAEPRYHVPLYPIFAIVVAGGAWALVSTLRDWRDSRLRPRGDQSA